VQSLDALFKTKDLLKFVKIHVSKYKLAYLNISIILVWNMDSSSEDNRDKNWIMKRMCSISNGTVDMNGMKADRNKKYKKIRKLWIL
jgi:hypothetical protein